MLGSLGWVAMPVIRPLECPRLRCQSRFIRPGARHSGGCSICHPAVCTLKEPSSTPPHFMSAPWNVRPTGGNVLSTVKSFSTTPKSFPPAPRRILSTRGNVLSHDGNVLSMPGMNASQGGNGPTVGRRDASDAIWRHETPNGVWDQPGQCLTY